MRIKRLSAMFSLCVSLLCGMTPDVVMADSSVPSSFNQQNGSRAEVTVSGTVQQVTTKPASGASAGIELQLQASSGTIVVNLGPYLSKDVQSNLFRGQEVQIVGTYHSLHGQTYLFARQLQVAGNTISIRNAQGFLIQTTSNSGAQKQSRLKGDIQ